MKERPIIFKPELVRAILDGRKRVTRRPVKLPKHNVNAIYFSDRGDCECSTPGWFADDISDGRFEPAECFASTRIRCPFGAIGTKLWVRETWGILDNGPDDYPYIIWNADKSVDWCDGAGHRAGDIHYVSSDTEPNRWRPSIHMPRWASRLTLEVTDIRAERLQEITEEDAKAEGVEPFSDRDNDCWSACNNPGREHLVAFEYKWNEIYGWSPNAWERNDWVWRIAFEVKS